MKFIICVSDYLKVVELLSVGRDNTLHVYVRNIIHIIDVLHENDNTIFVHMGGPT
jgi:hypothetical protein